MKKKNLLILDDEFIQYCEINNIQDIDKLAKETFNKGFTILKYGNKPNVDENAGWKEKIRDINNGLIKQKEETIKKWEDSGLLDGLKGHANPEIIKLYESEPSQIIMDTLPNPTPKNDEDIYGE